MGSGLSAGLDSKKAERSDGTRGRKVKSRQQLSRRDVGRNELFQALLTSVCSRSARSDFLQSLPPYLSCPFITKMQRTSSIPSLHLQDVSARELKRMPQACKSRKGKRTKRSLKMNFWWPNRLQFNLILRPNASSLSSTTLFSCTTLHKFPKDWVHSPHL